MKTLYLDIFSGISGDMFLGALIDLGLDLHKLEHELEKLHLPGYHLHVKRGERGQIAGTQFVVHLEDHCDHGKTEASGHSHEHSHDHKHDCGHDHSHDHSYSHDHGHDHKHWHDHDHAHGHSHSHEHDPAHDHGHTHSHEHAHDDAHTHGRNHAQIRDLIRRIELSAWVKEKALAVFQRVAVAEGKIHGKPASQVHFHEVGAVDSIVDIVGACVALDTLGRPRVLAGKVVEGVGFIRCAHGQFPLPAPATLEILGARGVRVEQTDEPNELITPTGAALIAEFAESFGPMPGLKVSSIGYGLGGRENKTRPNVLRAVLGETEETTVHDWERDEVVLLETNVDDVSPEILGAFLDKALAAGALDVFHTPIHMKKNRPGVLLSVLCASADADRFSELILCETTAFGVRRSVWERRKLRREIRIAKTSAGEIEVKLGWLDKKLVQVAPEYESCRRASDLHKVPLREVYDLARRAFQ